MAMLKEKNESLGAKLELYKEREEIVRETREEVEQMLDQQQHMGDEAEELEKEVGVGVIFWETLKLRRIFHTLSFNY